MIAPIDSINLEERLQNGPDRLDGAASSYQTYLKKFSVFLNAPVYNKKGPMIAAIFFNDENLAKYFIALGDEMKDVPHALKSARAAIAYGLQMNKLPLLAENSHLYPLTWRVIDVKQTFILMFLNNKY